MFDYQKLTQAPVEVNVPGPSKMQPFVLYQLNNRIDLNFRHVNYQLKDHVYLTVNGLTPKQKNLLLIPFQEPIPNDQVDNLDFNLIDGTYQRLQPHKTYRSKLSRGAFKIHYENKEPINAKEFIMTDSPHLNSEKLREGVKNFINSPQFKKIKTSPKELKQFLYAMANDRYQDIYEDADCDAILNLLQPYIPNIKDKYQRALIRITNDVVARNHAKRFGNYLQLDINNSQKDFNIENESITDILLSKLDSHFHKNSKLPIDKAGNLIASVFSIALLKQDGDDVDNVVLFDPTSGLWVHDMNVFTALLHAIKPYPKPSDVTTLVTGFAAEARNKNNFIEAYHQSRYLLFLNGVLDLKELKSTKKDGQIFVDIKHARLHPFRNYKDLHFTKRCQICINFNPKQLTPPVFPGERSDGKNWNPLDFIKAYADLDPAKLNFFLFCLSLGLFGGHNFGVNVNIRGISRWGKTTLVKIYQAIYPKRVFIFPYSKLNNPFAFTNYNLNDSLIWMDECNTDVDPLNTNGVAYYDNLSDDRAPLQVKHTNDIELNYPPQVYADGTSYVRARDMDTGPFGRTLVYKLPMTGESKHSIDGLLKSAYSSDINTVLTDKKTLQYLINLMITAYLTCLNFSENPNRLWNLRLNLGNHNQDTKLLPKFAQKWRQEMVEKQGDLQDWFTYNFISYVSTDKDHMTLMHDNLAYGLYRHVYSEQNAKTDPTNRYCPSINTFKTQFHHMLDSTGWTRIDTTDIHGNKNRKSVKYLSKTHFDVEQFKADGNEVPNEFTDENIDSDRRIPSESPYPLNTRTSGWYYLEPDDSKIDK